MNPLFDKAYLFDDKITTAPLLVKDKEENPIVEDEEVEEEEIESEEEEDDMYEWGDNGDW